MKANALNAPQMQSLKTHSGCTHQAGKAEPSIERTPPPMERDTVRMDSSDAKVTRSENGGGEGPLAGSCYVKARQ